jgi:hypothetical protein
VDLNIKKPADLLAFWQEIHGELDTKWYKEFLKDKSVKEILSHPTDKIKVAVRRNKKLVEILSDLRNQVDKKEAFLDKYDKYRNSREISTGSKIEEREREGKRWGRTF